MTTQTLIQPVPCPHCGADMHTTFDVEMTYGDIEDGKQIIHLALRNLEVIGGCEHAEAVRSEFIFRP
jgi:hypothetical protein